MGYFYWLRVQSPTHVHTELNLGYLKGTKFCLERKASFIDISSKLLHLSRFFFLGCGDIALFWTVPWLPWPKYTQLGTIFQKNPVILSIFFSSSNMFFIRLFLANT